MHNPAIQSTQQLARLINQHLLFTLSTTIVENQDLQPNGPTPKHTAERPSGPTNFDGLPDPPETRHTSRLLQSQGHSSWSAPPREGARRPGGPVGLSKGEPQMWAFLSLTERYLLFLLASLFVQLKGAEGKKKEILSCWDQNRRPTSLKRCPHFFPFSQPNNGLSLNQPKGVSLKKQKGEPKKTERKKRGENKRGKKRGKKHAPRIKADLLGTPRSPPLPAAAAGPRPKRRRSDEDTPPEMGRSVLRVPLCGLLKGNQKIKC